LRIRSSHISLLGNREENQDRVAVVSSDEAALLVVIDGMGGHTGGAQAARVTVEITSEAFSSMEHPILDPQGFLHLVIGRAHTALVALGTELPVEARPRATCALCLVQDGRAYWAHVGDSRIYHLRDEFVVERSRDHSHVEVLLQEGLITEDEIANHPMRNFVESCIGGDIALPGMTITPHKPLFPGDVVLACSDGFWSGLTDEIIASITAADGRIEDYLRSMGDQAVKATSPHSDNTSAAAIQIRS
jgi:serine/threonine protein phosphatase PrpC